MHVSNEMDISTVMLLKLLAGEMEDQTTLRTKINELAHELVTSSSPDFHSQKIVEMVMIFLLIFVISLFFYETFLNYSRWLNFE